MNEEDLRKKYPSGSSLNQEKPVKKEPKDSKEITPVASGKVKKKGFLRRSFDTIVGKDVDSVGGYIVNDVLAPAIRDTIVNVVTGGIEMLIYGETRTRGGIRGGLLGNSQRTSSYNYNGIYSGPNKPAAAQIQRTRTPRDFDGICFETRGEAEDVLSRMIDILETYNIISVADFYQLSNVASTPQDQKWGWTSLKDASVDRTRDGYVVALPKPSPI